MVNSFNYHKVPKFSNAGKLCCNLPKIQEKKPNRRVFCQKDAIVIANSEDPYQTAPSLIWVCTVCPDLYVRKLWIITVKSVCVYIAMCDQVHDMKTIIKK